MTKTPNEVKQGLEHAAIDCRDAHDCDKTCAYYKECTNFDYETTEIPCTMLFDALALIQQLEADKVRLLEEGHEIRKNMFEHIQQLEAQNAELLKKVEQLQAERDAAVEMLKEEIGCRSCAKYTFTEEYVSNDCLDCVNKCDFEWRGVQKEE